MWKYRLIYIEVKVGTHIEVKVGTHIEVKVGTHIEVKVGTFVLLSSTKLSVQSF